MSTQEQSDAVGKLVQEYVECKKNTMLLKCKLERYSAALNAASLHINGLTQSIRYSPQEWDQVTGEIPTIPQVRDACLEYETTSRRYNQLAERLKELGL